MKRLMQLTVAGLTGLLFVTAAPAAQDSLAAPGEPHGVVRADVERKAEQIFPVRIVEVDGELISADNKVALWLKPGKHTLTVRGGVDYNDTTFGLTAGGRTEAALRGATRMDNTFGTKRTVGSGRGENKLEIEIEEGKVYYIGGKRRPDTDNRWIPVVWKVEPGKGR